MRGSTHALLSFGRIFFANLNTRTMPAPPMDFPGEVVAPGLRPLPAPALAVAVSCFCFEAGGVDPAFMPRALAISNLFAATRSPAACGAWRPVESSDLATVGRVGRRSICRGGGLDPRLAALSSAFRSWRCASEKMSASVSFGCSLR